LTAPPERKPADSGSPAPETPIDEADRAAINDALARHSAAGRLSLNELEERVVRVLRATTREQAAAAISDLPPLAPADARRRRTRGHGETAEPGPGWIPTAERFRDPGTGRIMRVWRDPVTGERHYVAEPG
jgi:hypothetical protein